MALQLETDRIDPDITVVRVTGDLTFEETDALTLLVRALLDAGAEKVILDLSGVQQIDRVGGVSLVRCFFMAREMAGKLCVAGGSPSVIGLFKTTEVDTLIPFFSTVAVASDHLRSKSKTSG